MYLVSVSGHSFADLVLPLRAEMIGYASRLCGRDTMRAEDIVQDSYVRALKAWSRWIPDTPEAARDARAWLYRIVANEFAREYESRGKAARASYYRRVEIAEHLYDGEVVPERNLYRDSQDHPIARIAVAIRDSADTAREPLTDHVRDAIARLQPQRRQVIELRYLQGKTQQEIAEELRLPIGTVRSRINRALSRLRPLLARHGREEYALGRARVDVTDEPVEMVKAHAGGVKGVMRRSHRKDRAFVTVKRSPDKLSAG